MGSKIEANGGKGASFSENVQISKSPKKKIPKNYPEVEI